MPQHRDKVRRRVMRAFKINEISGVDTPAQQGATVVIMKRVESAAVPQTDDVSKSAALTTEDDGHTHLVILNGPPDGVEFSSGETTWQNGHTHPWVRTADGAIIMGVAGGPEGQPHSHQVAVTSKNDDDEPVNRGDHDMTTDTDTAAKHAEAIAELEKKIVTANALAALNDVDKAHMATIEGDDAQGAFLAKSADERKAIVENVAAAAKEDDPVAYTTSAGVELRKSAGPAVISLAQSNDALAKRVEELTSERDDTAFEKRAETELAHIPGDTATRAAMLKAIDGIKDKTVREAALDSLKAQDTALAKAFDAHGVNDSPVPGSPADQLDVLAKAHQEAHPELTPEAAYNKVLETAAGADLYDKLTVN